MMKLNIIGLVLLIVILCFVFYKNIAEAVNDGANKEAYQIESIRMPEGLTAEVGGLGFMPDGRLAACFHRGEVMTYNPETDEWKLFAEGLHDPLGLLVVSDSSILVMQQPELTRITDTNGDGLADLYENVTDDFGISGNYHEFNYGPVEDKDGNLFIALNTGSSGDGIRTEVRGKLNTLGRDGEKGNRQMFSVVPYRGWVLKLTPDGNLVPFAMGLRSPNGIGFDADGNLMVADNQGDWVSTSALYHVQEGKFYGHPASLVWKESWKKANPFFMPISELDSMRTKAAVLFPQGIMANSPAQVLCDTTAGKFGPFAGQLLVGEMNRERIVRVMLETVAGALQGACVPFIDGKGLRMGNNRLAFAPDGSLWVGQTDHGWAGAEGVQRISFTGEMPMDIQNMNLTPQGFDLTFTKPVDAETAGNPDNYNFRHYYYGYYKKDASEPVDKSIQLDVQTVPVTGIRISEDGKKVSVTLNQLKAGYIYELKLENIKCAEGKPLGNDLICYTLNNLIK
jgi:glucose/arabinose dehydrogenase